MRCGQIHPFIRGGKAGGRTVRRGCRRRDWHSGKEWRQQGTDGWAVLAGKKTGEKRVATGYPAERLKKIFLHRHRSGLADNGS